MLTLTIQQIRTELRWLRKMGRELRQLLYGNQDTGLAVTSGLRGHELARLAYGYNPTTPNVVPYSGIGMWPFGRTM